MRDSGQRVLIAFTPTVWNMTHEPGSADRPKPAAAGSPSCVMLVLLTTILHLDKTNKHAAMDSIGNHMDPAQWLDEHGDYLFRFAMKHLRDRTQAEDAVQETLLAALQAMERFSGEASQRSWLTGILKHKIVDIIRKQSRLVTQANDEMEISDRAGQPEKYLFDERGEWVIRQSSWGNPEIALEQDRFWDAFMDCLDGLSPKLAQIFSLRELSGLETTELCEVLNITSTNCWVILHRARLALKECLETNWLKEAGGRDA